MNSVVSTAIAPEIIESLVINGDLSRLNPQQKVALYRYRCQQAGLDPSAKPFDLLTLNSKQILYANAGCTQQLCAIHKLKTTITAREKVDDIYTVCARVESPDGRSSENMGAVPLAGLKGEALANAFLKATTKAIRRTVLAHVGLGMMDETEVETIPGAQRLELVDDSMTKQAAEYADRFSKAIEDGNDGLIVELKDELRGSQELELAIWTRLSAPVRRKIKDVLAGNQE
jgi:hypothetical protein